MKKLLIIASLLLASAFVFAESYEVKDVAGKVSCAKSAKEKSAPLKKGMTVTDETYITLGENSKLILVIDGKDVTLRIPKKATVAEMIAAKEDASSPIAKKGKGTATAASRASDVMAEGELDE